MPNYLKEDFNKFSDIEQEIITKLDLERHTIKVKRECVFSNEEIASGKAKVLKGYMTVDWSLSQIIKTNYDGYRILAKDRATIRNMIKSLLRITHLAPMGNHLPADIINNVIPKMGVFTESLRDSQSYIYNEEIQNHRDSLKVKTKNTQSGDIDNVVRLMQPEIYNKEREELTKKASRDVFKDEVKRTRLSKDHVYKVRQLMTNRVVNGKFTEYTSKFTDGLDDEEEFIVHFNLDTESIDITYDELLLKREILKFLTYEEIGNIMRTKNPDIPMNNPNLIRVNADKRRIEFKDELFDWYPVIDIDDINKLCEIFDIDRKLVLEGVPL